jgi:NADH:ubiquinone oxidoreductase subunit 6 (subunit J)
MMTGLVPIAISTFVGLIAIYWLLPRPRRFAPVVGIVVGMGALVLARIFLFWTSGLSAEGFLFYGFSTVAVVAGAMLVTQINPVHAALSFALVVLSTCGLFLLQGAPFLMAGTIIVYAGAIVVTFLFVIMLAQQAGLSDADHRSREPFFSALAGFLLLGTLLYLLQETYDVRHWDELLSRTANAASKETLSELLAAIGDDKEYFKALQSEADACEGTSECNNFSIALTNVRASWEDWKRRDDVTALRAALRKLQEGANQVRDTAGVLQPKAATLKYLSPYSKASEDSGLAGETVAALGRMLFTDYLIPVELAGTLLLVATIGAIAIASRRGEGTR